MIAPPAPRLDMSDLNDTDRSLPDTGPARDRPLGRLRRAVMARLFDDEPAPRTLGRYEIVRVIGAGGMGSVYAAHDPELDREVAVKLLHYTRDAEEGKRLLREAKGLARLSHENVVQVHDAGTDREQVFLAMELVRGCDLRQWLQAAPRSVEEIVATFAAAGRGLAAAHAAGLVHRDFKPENVLVRDDGVVKVADFGLVRSIEGSWVSSQRTPTKEELDAAAETLTRTGAAVGTPTYMAPEQHLALAVDARTDQFSFCIALYEAIYGQRPFRGETLRELMETTRSDVVAFPTRPRVPKSLRRVLHRGLRADPGDRYANMAALLGDLGSVAGARRRTTALAIAAVAGLSLAGLTLGGMMSRPSDDEAAPEAAAVAASTAADACDPQREADAAYDDAARERIAAHLGTIAPEIAEQAVQTADAALREYLTGWRAAYGPTCEPGADGDDARRLAKQLCLRTRLDEVRGTVAVLEQADATIAASAAQIVAGIEPLAECEGDRLVVRAGAPVDRDLVLALSRARSLWHAKQPQEAYDAAESLAVRAADAGQPEIEGEAWFLAGQVANFEPMGQEGRRLARQAYQQALDVARRIQDPRLSLRAEVMLAFVPEDNTPGAVAQGVEAFAARIEASPDPYVKWAYEFRGATPFSNNGTEESRREHATKMLALAREHFGAGHRLLDLSRRIAEINDVRGRSTADDEAVEVGRVVAMFGAKSRRAAEAKSRLGSLLRREERFDEAIAVYEEVAEIWTELEGPRSTQVGDAWREIASVYERQGKLEQALAALDPADAGYADDPATDHKGEEHVLANLTMQRASLLFELGRIDEAARVLDVVRAREGETSTYLARHWADTAGRIRLAAGDSKGALDEYAAGRLEHGLTDERLQQWRDEPELFVPLFVRMFALLLVGEAEVRLQLGQAKKARALAQLAYDRVTVLTDRPDHSTALLARAALVLARSLATSEPDRSRDVARHGLAVLDKAGRAPRQATQLRASLQTLAE